MLKGNSFQFLPQSCLVSKHIFIMSSRIAEARNKRDLYAEIMKNQNPKYRLLTEAELADALKTEPEHKAPEKPQSFVCNTQSGDTLEELYLGENAGTIELWKKQSVINWSVRVDSFPTFMQARQAAVMTYRAAQIWNDILEGRVAFKFVTRDIDACFQLRYGGVGDGVLARAFFPSSWRNSLNFVVVFDTQFDRRFVDQFVPTMLHELGHVLGLRHEHSQSELVGRQGPYTEDLDFGLESILFGPNNPKSVMSYNGVPTIQDSDAKYVRKAYDELGDGSKISGKGIFGTVTKTVVRVEPNN